MFDIVNVTVMGRVSSLPELRKTKEGESYSSFNIAVNPAKDVTNFYTIICFGKIAEYAMDAIEMGKRCTCVGFLQMTTEEKDNTVKYRLRVKANVIFPGVLKAAALDKKGNSNASIQAEEEEIYSDEYEPF